MVQTVFPPRSPGNNWAYWKVTNLVDLPAQTKRRRNTISFILTPEGAEAHGPLTCVHCHKAIEDTAKNVYGSYSPKTRMAKCWHYECGWGALLSDIIENNMMPKKILAPENIQL